MELEVLLHLLIHSSVRRLGRIRSGNRVLEVNSRVLWNKPSETAYTNRSIRAQSLKSPEGTRKHKKTISLRFVRVGIRYNPYVLYVSVSGKAFRIISSVTVWGRSKTNSLRNFVSFVQLSMKSLNISVPGLNLGVGVKDNETERFKNKFD